MNQKYTTHYTEVTKLHAGNKVVFWGPSISLKAELDRYDKGLCPAPSNENCLVVGGIYTVVAVDEAYDGTYIDVQGTSIKGYPIYVNGVSSSNFQLITKGRKSNKLTKTVKSMRLTNLAKKLLDADTRTLIKAGYIDGDLELTDAGQRAALSILFIEKKDELVKMAQDEIKEQTED